MRQCSSACRVMMQRKIIRLPTVHGLLVGLSLLLAFPIARCLSQNANCGSLVGATLLSASAVNLDK